MSTAKKIALTVAILGGLIFLLTRSRPIPHKAATSNFESGTPSATLNSRAHKDVNTLARALSLVAAKTIGLVEVSGWVLDRQSGEPIADAEVVFTGPSGESGAQCDAEGRYSLELIPGFYRSYAQATEYVAVAPKAAERLPKQDLAPAVAMPRASIAPLAGLFRDQPSVDLYLVGGATLQAQVVDMKGRAIAGALVAAESDARVQLLSGTDVGESDNNGKVRRLA